jgi:hypothetical protein
MQYKDIFIVDLANESNLYIDVVRFCKVGQFAIYSIVILVIVMTTQSKV